jgi:hypothetical protein
MRRYSKADKADVRRRMSPSHRQSIAQISAQLGIGEVTLYNWRKAWLLQGVMVPAFEKDPEARVLPTDSSGYGNRCAERHRTQRLPLGAGPVPGAGVTVATGIPGCQRKTIAHLLSAEGA